MTVQEEEKEEEDEEENENMLHIWSLCKHSQS
jgi:hypothetical protein